MTLVAVVGARSPGTTTTAVALAATWPGGAVLVEADPAGGSLAAELGAAPTPGLQSLAAESRRGGKLDVAAALQTMPNGVPVLMAPVSPAQACAALNALGMRLAGTLATSPWPVVVDCGRLDAGSPSADIVAAADLVVLVLRSRLPDVAHAAARVAGVDTFRTGVVVIGDRPYRPSEVAAELRLPLLGVLPDDPSGAASVSSGGRLRSSLLRSARVVAEHVAPVVSHPVEAQ